MKTNRQVPGSDCIGFFEKEDDLDVADHIC